MPIPPYKWLKDGGGADIQESVDVQDREGSIEIIGRSHGINLPVYGSDCRYPTCREWWSTLIPGLRRA